MKIKNIFLFGVLLMSASMQAQTIKLDTYKFGEGLNFTNDDGYRMKLTGYIQPYLEIKHYTEGVDNSSVNRFRLRRARFRIAGNLKNERFKYRFAFDLSGTSEDGNTTSNYLQDAYISYDITNRIRATFGQRSTYTDNRELFMASNTLQLVERSRVTSAFASIREFGLFMSGNFRSGRGSYLRPYFVLTNGDGGNVLGKDHGGLKVGGRIDYLPFGLFTNFGQFRQADIVRESAPKLVVGVNFSHNNGMSSRRGRGSGDIIYLNDANEESLPDFTKYGVDFMLKYSGFSVLGEYVKTKATVPDDITQRILNSGSISTNFEVDGIQDVENYVKGRMMLGDAFNIQMGYVFKNGISIDGRYTHLNADEHSFLNNATFYNRPNYYTIGISKYLSRSYGAKIQASWTYVDGSDGINDNNGNPISGNETLARLILTLAL
ncbi:OprO/OprP family phosphate-selective porin [Flaviramulus sp. BrNp1-15]|uniref:porin n=1 Tax=Flaviramulus sp. BrNp1-15 TaxID=2916754 RepID=UPI001EE819ED|nr:porin [Flaviramulus sp. BrNp1-15]ULC59567.1 OprO/OprP family phosphate-selective porin [Flaviramulus sp. BrNp1-15]